LQIQERIKGIRKKNTLHFYFSTSSSTCGVDYAEGSELYVFLHPSGGGWSTGACSGNISKKHISDEEKRIIKEYKTANGKQEWFNEYKKLEAVGKIKNQKSRGKWEFYFSDGTIAAEGKYKKGLKKGKWKIYKKPANQPEYDEVVDSNKEKTEVILKSILYYKKGEKIKTETVEEKKTE
jgi:antitoxin component YwqK of YwqJK toxin-antitoxin module